MLAAIASAWALLLGIALIMLGNGLQGTLLGVRATLEGFGTGTTGLVMTGYFAGFLAGSMIVPRLLANVGHIRVFAALASLASGAALLHTVFVTPVSWFMIRVITGFCFAGLYVVAESWINDAATNRTRGQLLSVYMIMVLGGMGSGQLLMNLSDPRGFELFVLVSVLVSFALIPITLSVGRAPAFEAPESIGIRALFRASPLGVAGAFLIGIAHSALYSMGPVYGTEIGLAVDRTALFIAVALFGGLVLQWPIGWLSDRFDRRKVIVAVAWIAAGASMRCGRGRCRLLRASHRLDRTCLAACRCRCTRCAARTPMTISRRDKLSRPVPRWFSIGGFGTHHGSPARRRADAHLAGPPGLFWLLAMVHGCIGAYGLYRMVRREPVPLEEQRTYDPVSLRTSPVVQAATNREWRDTRDRDLARWSKW